VILPRQVLDPLVRRIESHTFASERIQADMTVPVLALGKTVSGRIWSYVKDDASFGGTAPRGTRLHGGPFVAARTCPRQTGKALAERLSAGLRRQRLTGKHIAVETGVSPAAVIHLDIKRLGSFDRVGHRVTGTRKGQRNSRGVGWDTSMSALMTPPVSPLLASSQTKAVGAIAFLRAAVAYYKSLGITLTRVMTDNGSC
jgi:hypothetical protein